MRLFKLFVLKERFFRDSELSGTDNTKWWIPLTYTTECEFDFNRTVARKWLSPHSDSVSIKGPLSPGDWMIFNVNASGLYLIDYDQENWKLIINFLNRSSIEHIPSLTGVTLVESAANLAWIGRLDYKIFFDLVKCTAKSKEIQYNYAATSHVYDLSFLLRKTPVHARFVDYVIKVLLNNHSPHLRAKNRISKFRIHRMRGIRGPCKYDMEACVNELVFSQPETTMNYVIAM